MDCFGAIALLWLATAVIATFLGFLRGRTSDAVTLGVLLGPVGLVLVMFLSRAGEQQEEAVLLKIGDAQRRVRQQVDAEPPLRRAA